MSLSALLTSSINVDSHLFFVEPQSSLQARDRRPYRWPSSYRLTIVDSGASGTPRPANAKRFRFAACVPQAKCGIIYSVPFERTGGVHVYEKQPSHSARKVCQSRVRQMTLKHFVFLVLVSVLATAAPCAPKPSQHLAIVVDCSAQDARSFGRSIRAAAQAEIGRAHV